MNLEHEPTQISAPPPQRRTWLWLLVPALAFLFGLVAMGWLLSRWERGAQMLGVAPAVEQRAAPAPEPVRPRPEPQPAEPAAATPPAGEQQQTLVIDPEITRRVAELERRFSDLNTQSRAAVGNADRAEGLLVAFAARRALDRGVSLGFLEALLRQRFGATQAQAVGTVIAAAREPVTLQELQEGLQRVGPQLRGVAPDQGWWTAFKAEMGSLITVRREGTPSTDPSDRLRRAMRRLEAGQVDVALAEVLRMPGQGNAAQWIEDARRYIRARRALDAIETAALLEPRQPAGETEAAEREGAGR